VSPRAEILGGVRLIALLLRELMRERGGSAYNRVPQMGKGARRRERCR